MATATTVSARLAALRSTIDDTITDALRTSPMTYGGRGVYPTNDREFFRVCRVMGFATSKREGEYRICPNGCGEAAAYHTTDRRDAFDTAQAIATDMAYQREAGRTAACLRAIVEDMDAEQLAAFDPLAFAVPYVDAVGIVAAEKVRRASVVARMDAARDDHGKHPAKRVVWSVVREDGSTLSRTVLVDTVQEAVREMLDHVEDEREARHTAPLPVAAVVHDTSEGAASEWAGSWLFRLHGGMVVDVVNTFTGRKVGVAEVK